MSKYVEFVAAECNDKELVDIIEMNQKRYDLALNHEARETLSNRLKELHDLMWSRRTR